jgi:flagellar L-ring protein precursor FlgH
MKTYLLLVAVAPLLAGCLASEQARPDPAYAVTLAPAPLALPPAASDGSIFQASAGYAPLTSGARAARVGDVLTIALIERTQAVKSNSANVDKSGSFGLTPPSTGPLALFKPSDVSVGGGTNFKGGGSAQQSNALSGEISVTVAEVYANGTMLVRGEKLIRLNRGDEYVRFSGLVRAADIGPENIVASSRVADAHIDYGGAGEIAQASKQGWLQKFFNMVSPF